MVAARWLAKRAQVIKRYTCPTAGAGRRRRVAEVRHHVYLGTPDAYRQALGALGFSGRIQTAFIERLHLTIRRSIAGLARRSWTLRAARSLGELALQFEWWRAIYHFARPHASLRIAMALHPSEGNQRQRYRQRTPAQAAGLTDHRWTVLELLGCPAPPLTAGSPGQIRGIIRKQRLRLSTDRPARDLQVTPCAAEADPSGCRELSTVFKCSTPPGRVR